MNFTEFSESWQNQKNGMVTKGSTQPATDTLQFIVIECAFPLLPFS